MNAMITRSGSVRASCRRDTAIAARSYKKCPLRAFLPQLPDAKTPGVTLPPFHPSIQPDSAAQTTINEGRPYLASSQAALELLKQQSMNRYAGNHRESIIAVGLTVHNAPVALRERLSVPESEWPRAIGELVEYPHIEEAAVLSTCNRMEIYIVGLSAHPAIRDVEEWLSRTSGIPREELRPYLFLLRGRDATEHIMRVSSGLDSLVLGEGQILAQVKHVYNVGQSCPGFGRQLTALFKQALSAGKRVRSETSISSGSVSVSSAAVELAIMKEPSHNLSDKRVCVIGAGKMAMLLVKHLAAKGCRNIIIVNRSIPRAQAIADDFPEIQFEVHTMGQLTACVERSDIIFAASSSEEILVTKEQVQGMSSRPITADGDAARRFFDISVPRNIDPGMGEASTSTSLAELYNVDDLKQVIEANKEERLKAAATAESLTTREAACFEAWRDSLGTVPTIKALRCKAEQVRAAEFSRAVSKLGDGMSKKQLAVVEELSRAIVNKLLHGPMAALRCDGSDPNAIHQTLASMDALEHMFELSTVDISALPLSPSKPKRSSTGGEARAPDAVVV